jgi:catechol 2,3-dioxygenase-like lactoylglutathione lyase family enzyme
MIKGLYETHIFVESLERSVDFYKNVLGLQEAHHEAGRRITFFWIGEPKEYMLGVWEKPKTEIDIRHFAFRCEADFILKHSVGWLKERNLQPYNFLKDDTGQPMVFAWMPAIAIYFNDPDGHVLEFIAVLPGEAKPELGVTTYAEWVRAANS